MSVFIPIPKKGNAKECSNYECTIALISHASKVMLKILQARLQQYMIHELPEVQAGFKKARETIEIKLPTSAGSWEKQESSREQQGEDKKAFLSEQCKETEENNRMGKTSDHFKETADTWQHFIK